MLSRFLDEYAGEGDGEAEERLLSQAAAAAAGDDGPEGLEQLLGDDVGGLLVQGDQGGAAEEGDGALAEDEAEEVDSADDVSSDADDFINDQSRCVVQPCVWCCHRDTGPLYLFGINNMQSGFVVASRIACIAHRLIMCVVG